VREPAEQTEMAAGALAVPYRLLAEADLSALDPERPTAVVCHTGTRSPLAASLLARRGFTHVRPVLGEGMSGWSARDHEAAVSAAARASAKASSKAAAKARAEAESETPTPAPAPAPNPAPTSAPTSAPASAPAKSSS
jgi:rhodanese-related sulfurtransferase